MKRSKLIFLFLIGSMIILTINIVSFDAITPKESLARAENDQDPPEMEWNRTYGESPGEVTWGPYRSAEALVQTSDGGFALFGDVGHDIWLVKTDENGVPQWDKTFGGTDGYDNANAIVQTSDGGFVLAGSTSSFGAGLEDMWLIKTDANGVTQWNKTYGGTEWDSAEALVQTSDGGFVLAGYTHSFEAGRYDMWLVKTDANGVAQWNQTYGGSSGDYANALVQTADGGFALAGNTHSFGAGGSADMWLVKTDVNGVAQWTQTFGGTKGDLAYALVQTSDGGFALAGFTRSFSAGGSADMWLVKTDANGVAQWTQTFGGTEWDSAEALVQTSDGGFALAGSTNSFGAGGPADMWLVKTDANGVAQWNQTFGGTGSDSANALVQTSDGGFALAGYTLSFGASEGDMWLVKTESTTTTTTIPSWNVLLLLLSLFAMLSWRQRKKKS